MPNERTRLYVAGNNNNFHDEDASLSNEDASTDAPSACPFIADDTNKCGLGDRMGKALGNGFLMLIAVVVMGAVMSHHPSASVWPSSSLSSSFLSSDDAPINSYESASFLQLGSKKHKKKKSHDHDDSKDDTSDADDSDTSSTTTTLCSDGRYSKRTLKLAYELAFAALFRDHKGERKYEASSVIVEDNFAYAVCDSSWSIAKFGADLTPFAPTNVQLGDPHKEVEDSGYEAILHEKGVFYVVRESIQHADLGGSYHAIVEELALGEEDYTVGEKCSSEFEFEGDSKGFEGAIALYDLNNEMVILGLCEGNHCSQTHKNDKGNGRLVAMRKGVAMDGITCQWKTIRMIDIPSSAMFRDYSAVTVSETGKVAISSQEESQLWVGSLLGRNNDTGLWDIDALSFDSSKGKLYDFPKNDNCETIYCNIEGVHWLNDDTVMAVSDKMKGRGKQDYRCFDKDQSVHVFVLPA